MSDAGETPDASTEVAVAVRNLMPQLRTESRLAIALMGAAIVTGLAIAFVTMTSNMDTEGRWKISFFAAFGGCFLAFLAHKRMRRQQEALVMPVLASAVGLTYAKDAKPFLRALPERLLPKRGIKTAEDHITGSLGAHRVEMAEIKVETGGKNSRTLFAGLVVRFPNRTAMPAFFIAREDKTREGWLFGGELSTDGLYHLRSVIGGGGASYGIWTSWTARDEPPALAPVVEAVTKIEDRLGRGTQLYAATSNGEEMHLALAHSRNLYRLGGVFPDEHQIFADVREAMQDLSVPLTLAKALIEAEEVAAAKT
ncbi:MAG: hypothetical protein JNN02_05530 [Tabrizicola sp.]|nr:hypothetical protein [Tabrizicola sp.]